MKEMKPNFCIDCAYHWAQSAYPFDAVKLLHWCRAPLFQGTNLVTGNPVPVKCEDVKVIQCSEWEEKSSIPIIIEEIHFPLWKRIWYWLKRNFYMTEISIEETLTEDDMDDPIILVQGR